MRGALRRDSPALFQQQLERYGVGINDWMAFDRDFQGRVVLQATPLHLAVSTRAPRCVEWLLKEGADPCARNKGGWHETPMGTAALYSSSVACVRLLIEAGAPARDVLTLVYPKSVEHSIVSMTAVDVFDTELVSFLLRHGSWLLPDERGSADDLCAAEKVMRTRWDRCRRVCMVLLKTAPFQQKCLRREWVRRYVWPLRSLRAWTPDMVPPQDYANL